MKWLCTTASALLVMTASAMVSAQVQPGQGSGSGSAQPPSPKSGADACTASVKKRQPDAAAALLQSASPCEVLGTLVYAQIQDHYQAQINAATAIKVTEVPVSAIQPKDNDAKGGQGSPAQSSAVPSVQPVSNAGGTVALAGTNAGTAVVTSVALNPATLFTDPDPSKVQTVARQSRFADLSLIIPGNLSSTLPNGDISYVGVRARVNVIGLSEGDKAYKAVLDVQTKVRGAYLQFKSKIAPALSAAPDTDKCADAIGSQDASAMQQSCGTVVSLPPDTATALHAALVDAAAKADTQYLGLDLRADFGDPTFSNDPTAGGTYILAAIAGGKELNSHLAVRARAGIQYTKLTKDSTATYAFDGGGAVEINGGEPQRRVRVSIGLEGRTGSKDVLADQHFLDLHVGLSVPIADGKSLGIGLAQPLHFEATGTNPHTTLLSITGDWSLLLPSLGS